MAVDNNDGVYLKVDLNYNGVFVANPYSYHDGEHFLFTDVDFAAMDFNGCCTFLERYVGRNIVKLYYCLRDRSLTTGIRLIEDEIDYAVFIEIAYEEDSRPISLYLDHNGFDPEEESLFGSEDSGSVISTQKPPDSCSQKHPESSVEKPHATCSQKPPDDSSQIPNDDIDAICPDEYVPLNNTCEDEFLSKLCPPVIDDEPMEEDDVVVHPRFNPNVHWRQQKPILGMRFENAAQLRTMLINYAVHNGYQLFFKKNDKKRLLAMCSKGACPFRLWGSWMTSEHSFQIKSLKDNHECGRDYKLGSIVNYKWIGGHYTKEILHRQKLTIRQLRLEVIKKFGIDVSLSQCRRAKKHAMTLIEGTLVEHYAKLWSYGEEIRRSNPGSTVKIGVNNMPDGTTYFSRFYVCFEGVKKGWIAGCRRVVGIDGCFLKGYCTGELLCAVGRDGNNQIYPIAWGVVNVENKDNWKWFLELLVEDLNLDLGQGFTLMSDQHKGLLEAVNEILPHAEHRQCARHIVANFSRKFPGAHFENLFWKACRATTEAEYKGHMKELETLCPPAYTYLVEKDPKTWSRAYYQTGRCCDAVENGCSESFNAVIVDARKKPIITMLEELRIYMMNKLFTFKQKGWSTDTSPVIRKKLNDFKRDQRFWHVLPSGLNKFEAKSGNESFDVDLEKRTCACRLWQLNGYGCVHSVAAISSINRKPEDYVDPIFKREMYMQTYEHSILPMNGSSMWPETTYLPPLPPVKRRMPGRPKTKRIRSDAERVGKHKVSRAGRKVACGICRLIGHNRSTCPSKERPTKLPARKTKTKHGAGTSKQASASVGDPVQGSASVGDVPVQQSASERRGRKRSERIMKNKLAKRVKGKNGEGDSSNTPVDLD